MTAAHDIPPTAVRMTAGSFRVRAAWRVAMSLDTVEFFEFAAGVQEAVDRPATPRERRLHDLGSLAAMLDRELADAPPGMLPWVTKDAYVQQLPPESASPSPDELIRRYGGGHHWGRVVRCARALAPDGSRRPGGKPWCSPGPGPRFTAEEVLDELKAALQREGRLPSNADALKDYVMQTRYLARETRNAKSRMPYPKVIRQHFPSVAEAVRRAATDEQLVAARLRLLPPEWVAAVTRTDPQAAAQEIAQERDLPDAVTTIAGTTTQDLAALPVSDAIEMAQLLNGSLRWLVGKSAGRGRSPTGEQFDAATFKRLRRQRRGVSEVSVRGTLGLSVGGYRRLVSGRLEPNVRSFLLLADLLGVSEDSLLR